MSKAPNFLYETVKGMMMSIFSRLPRIPQTVLTAKSTASTELCTLPERSPMRFHSPLQSLAEAHLVMEKTPVLVHTLCTITYASVTSVSYQSSMSLDFPTAAPNRRHALCCMRTACQADA